MPSLSSFLGTLLYSSLFRSRILYVCGILQSVFISKVVPEGPSEQAGLQVGDKLLMVSV